MCCPVPLFLFCLFFSAFFFSFLLLSFLLFASPFLGVPCVGTGWTPFGTQFCILVVTWTGRRAQVSYALPFLADAVRGSTYFFINVTLACTKYEGAEFKNVSEVMYT